ncbi:MAG: hypothetical protein GY832_37485 [Chloroflexi bacterium]|nr:hypothetical protein [Chloroflexota bacterium]
MASITTIDLDGNSFHLTGSDRPVAFDIDADGSRETVTWTAPEASDALLCRDIDGNGMIDDGTELFGNATRLTDGSVASNGYIALAEYDAAALGGNENGFIDGQDAIFAELRVWVDSNHNGTSESSEVFPLDSKGITRIDLSYRTNERRDRHGNRFRYNSKAWRLGPGNAERPIQTSDVFFVLTF